MAADEVALVVADEATGVVETGAEELGSVPPVDAGTLDDEEPALPPSAPMFRPIAARALPTSNWAWRLTAASAASK